VIDSLAQSVTIVPMQANDLDEIVAVERNLYEFPWTRGNFEDSLAAGYSAWAARESGVLSGYMVTMMVLDEAHLLNLSVRRERQRRGLASSLLAHSFDAVRGHGAISMFLEVRPSNVPALGLYRRFGFEAVGRRKGYYPARQGREDALIMNIAL
jgi:ribosomal-protein-alanine N-acetyltransferase